MAMDAVSSQPHVLVVTADDAYAEACVTHLQSEFRMTSVPTVEAAMGKVVAGEVDCIISDHDTPDVDAVAFLEAIRIQHPDLPFILLTSQGSEDVASRAIHARVTDYLFKERYRGQWDQLAAMIDRSIDYHRHHPEFEPHEYRAEPILDAMPDMIGVLRDGHFVYVNPSGVDLLGLDSDEELLGRRLLDTFVEENGPTKEKLTAIQRGEAHLGVVSERMEDLTGERIPVQVTLSPIDWRGEPAVLAIISDRSERKSIVRQLGEKVATNALIRDTNHLIISAESRAELETAVCDRFVESESYRMAWIGGYDPISETVEPRASAGYEVGYLDDIDITMGVNPTGQGPTGLALQTGETQVMQDIAEDPQFAPWRDEALERGYRSSVALPLRANGTLYGVFNLYSDRPWAFDEEELSILEVLAGDIAFAIRSIETRADLERERERLRLASEAARLGVWDWLMDTDEVVWDEHLEDMFGLDPGTFEGTYEAFVNRIHPDDRPDIEQAIEIALEQSGIFESEFRIRPDNGGERWILSMGTVITDHAGDPIRMTGVNVDITERKDRELHMRVIDRVLRHNIHNDLNVIGGYAEVIGNRTTGEIAEFADVIEDYSRRLLATADKEREIVEILTEPPSPTECDLVDLVEQSVGSFGDRYPDVEIDLDTSERITTVVSDWLARAFEELLENAIVHNDQATPEVTIELEETGDEIKLRIADNGPPIPAENVDVLTARSEAPLFHGSGLGLWLVHWIVGSSDGTLEFEQNTPRGNVVTIRLPSTDGRGGDR